MDNERSRNYTMLKPKSCRRQIPRCRDTQNKKRWIAADTAPNRTFKHAKQSSNCVENTRRNSSSIELVYATIDNFSCRYTCEHPSEYTCTLSLRKHNSCCTRLVPTSMQSLSVQKHIYFTQNLESQVNIQTNNHSMYQLHTLTNLQCK